MIERVLKSKVARAAFFTKYNDIDVFVEDASKETKKLFAMLLSGALDGEVTIDCVFPLGPKAAVLDACKSDSGVKGRRRVYIVDGDMELCTSSRTDCVPRLFVLPRYCVENFLVANDAASVVVATHSLTLTSSAAGAALDFDGWLSRNATPLRDLYLAYAASRMSDPRVATVSLPLSGLLSDDSGVVDSHKVYERIDQFRHLVDSVEGAGVFDAWIAELRGIRVESPEEFVLKFVSGKDVLVPLLRMRMNRVERIAKGLPFLKVELASHVVASELTAIIDRAA